MEHQESYLKVIFGFMGVTDVTIVRAEGVAMGPTPRLRPWKLPRLQIEQAQAVAA
jgi:FMN-dependent NADH-azoreductase